MGDELEPKETGAPFPLPRREIVTRVRERDAEASRPKPGPRTQAMRGFDEAYSDIVDYIVRITDRIWVERAIGLIYDTYDPACAVYSMYGVVRSVEEVVIGTVTALDAFPDGEPRHLNVAWSGDEDAGFYTSHLGVSSSTNLGTSVYGPATGRRVALHFVADCISRANRIHTEWLVRDAGAQVRALGLDRQEVARTFANTPALDVPMIAPPGRTAGPAPARSPKPAAKDAEAWIRALYHDLWALRRLDLLERYYADDVVCHAGGGRLARGTREISRLLLHVMAGLPDGVMRVDHVCWSRETDGVIVAVRWVLIGTTRPGGFLGDAPAGQPVAMMGASHHRFAAGKIVEEWMIFDEIGALTQAYRGQMAREAGSP
ncbi:MAG: ester cyclase [Caulobacteraceae bacterium]|nr:ester cyclase [Caulobacteraceae bacterium]